MISEEMIKLLIKFLKENSDNKQKRKILKTLVDSIVEQLCQYYFDSIPIGIMNVRKLVNQKISSASKADQKLLKALDNLLRLYNDAFTKTYTDYSSIFDEFVNNHLINLLREMINVKLIVLTEKTKELEELL